MVYGLGWLFRTTKMEVLYWSLVVHDHGNGGMGTSLTVVECRTIITIGGLTNETIVTTSGSQSRIVSSVH